MGSPFCYVNIYRCRSNGARASDTDLLSPGKNAVWCWERSSNLAYRGRGWHIHETKPHTHKLWKWRLVTPGWYGGGFWLGNCPSSYGRCGSRAIPLGPHPPVTAISRKARLLPWHQCPIWVQEYQPKLPVWGYHVLARKKHATLKWQQWWWTDKKNRSITTLSHVLE